MTECILYARQYPVFWNPAVNKRDKIPATRSSQLEREIIREKDSVVSRERVPQEALGAQGGRTLDLGRSRQADKWGLCSSYTFRGVGENESRLIEGCVQRP